ncbi:hypothetical protein SUGI_0317440 [Cryptomeria japonica]|uniref:uncharacterized protein LOC131033642 n=1 Tax=Cryptomeria japonica TaxID=3369 RepID=UPI002408B130|nr:uncharacterized protein LOC131033642 [Cryptomeria japonica]GLJ18008.1 hypothetical protein SUGI_0317440 [Cryptomeria japonica]
MNAQAHVAGLRRLSARANNKVHHHINPTTTAGPLQKGLDSFSVFGKKVIDHLRKKQRIPIDKGLSDEEFVRIEATFAFSFPPDLRAILQEGMPVGVGFPDWRSGGSQQISMRLNLPIAGLSYEVAKGRFWCKQWGQRPVDMESAVAVARANLKKVPVLVPIYGHCYIPSCPNLAGNPVFFVYKNEVLCCGFDLGDFFEREEFGLQEPLDFTNSFRHAHDSLMCLRRDRSLRSMGHYRKSSSKDEFELINSDHLDDDKVCKNIEAWGRNLDSLAKCSDFVSKKSFLEWPRRSVSVSDRHPHPFLSGCNSPKFLSNNTHLQERIISDKILANLAVSPSPWSASKAPRWIQFWSDLAENRSNSSFSCVTSPSPERLFSSSKVDIDVAEDKYGDDGIGGCINIAEICMPRWVMEYLEELANILRNGGWKERDINDMLLQVSSSNLPGSEDIYLDSQTIIEGLLLKADLMSNSLRKAGWSSKDVAEIFNIEYNPIRKPTKKISPELAERIGKLAEFVARA